MLLYEAAPKCISKRTSYLQVWLAFHPYPQVIRAVFTLQRFRPPRHFTVASPCSWIDHLVSGLMPTTKNALFRLAFATAPYLKYLTLPLTLTPWAIKQKVRRQVINTLRQLVSIRFQVLFHSPLGVLFNFPSRYWFTIGHLRVFSLGGWSPQIQSEFHVFRSTQVCNTAI